MLRRELLATASVAVGASLERLWGRGVDRRGTDDAETVGGTGGSTWPQYQHDSRNTGHVPGASAPRDGVAESWSFATGGKGWKQPPAVDDDTVYVGGNALHALDREMGVKRWEFGTNERWGFSGPAVGDGVVCCVNFGEGTSRLYGVNAADGSKRWEYEFERFRTVPAPVTITGGTVYVTGPARTHAVDASSGEREWMATAGYNDEDGRTPAVTDDSVYTPGSGVVTALDRADGSKRWEYDISAPTSPVVADGRVYVAGHQGSKYRVVGIDAANGTGVWQVTLGSRERARPEQSPVVVDGTLVVASNELRAFDTETGDQVWTADAGWSPNAPVTDGDTVYVSQGYSSKAWLGAFDATDGAELWRNGLGSSEGSPTVHTPAVASESLYLHGENTFFALAPDNDPPVADVSFEPTEPTTNETVTFDASASSDPEGAITVYEWDVGDDGTVDARGEKATLTFSEAGAQTVVLTVEDDRGATDSIRTSVRVREPNVPPSPEFSVTPSTPHAGQQVTFDASASSDPGGSVASYEWDLTGDGTTDATGETVTHTFEAAGTYDVELTVTDDDGASESTSVTVSVVEATPTPTETPTERSPGTDGRTSTDEPPSTERPSTATGGGSNGPGTGTPTPNGGSEASTATPTGPSSSGPGASPSSGPKTPSSPGSGSPSTGTPGSGGSKSVVGALTALLVGLFSTELLVVVGVAVVAVLIVVTWERQVEGS